MIVSHDGANTTAVQLNRGVVTVVPLTSNVSRVYPFQVLPPATECGLPRDSKAQAERVRSVAIGGSAAGWASSRRPSWRSSTTALRLHLAL